MRASLVRMHEEESCNGCDLRQAWHEHMEKNRRGSFRREFFVKVISEAEKAINHFAMHFILLTTC